MWMRRLAREDVLILIMLRSSRATSKRKSLIEITRCSETAEWLPVVASDAIDAPDGVETPVAEVEEDDDNESGSEVVAAQENA